MSSKPRDKAADERDYIDDCDTPADMHGDGPGETLKPGNLDALAGDSTAHPPSIKQTIEEMRAIDADWKNLDDPVQELLDIRYGRAPLGT